MDMKILSTALILSTIMSFSFMASTQAATIAIMDTGADQSHPLLKNHRFYNQGEIENGLDDDANGYVDDLSGWNLITNSPLSFDPEIYPDFEEDFYRYYEIRRKRSLDISSESEDEWYQEKRRDDAFQEKRKKFRRYIHATHVSALATGASFHWGKGPTNYREYDRYTPNILSFTYLGDTEQGIGAEPEFKPLEKGSEQEKLAHLKSFIADYLTWQKKKLGTAIAYNAQFAQVINSSFGISYKSSGNMIEDWWKEQFEETKSNPSKENSTLLRLQDDFRTGLIELTKDIVERHPKVLFVFSAGNGNDDTTKESHYPSTVDCDHCLTVGATLGTFEKASFSNYGKKTVSLFAPGVAIPSAVPPARLLPVNGTSQAAPQVAHAASVVYEIFSEAGYIISMNSVKMILMDTVDEKTFLSDISVSGGILNLHRAVRLTKGLLRNRDFSSQNYQRILNQVKRTVADQIAPDSYRLPEKGFHPPLEADPLQFFPLPLSL